MLVRAEEFKVWILRVERPFVYRIINKRSGIILFAGLVVDPTRN